MDKEGDRVREREYDGVREGHIVRFPKRGMRVSVREKNNLRELKLYEIIVLA